MGLTTFVYRIHNNIFSEWNLYKIKKTTFTNDNFHSDNPDDSVLDTKTCRSKE
jgi:hypothetical protein